MACQLLKELLHQKHLICFSPVSSLYFSILSSSQILFSGQTVTLVVEDTSEMMDRDEEVALEFSNWIGGSDGNFSLSGVILL